MRQVITSLTIPFWVPILERYTGRWGVYWVRDSYTAGMLLACMACLHCVWT